MYVSEIYESDLNLDNCKTVSEIQETRWNGRDLRILYEQTEIGSTRIVGRQMYPDDCCVKPLGGRVGGSVDTTDDGKVEAEGHVKYVSEDKNTTVEAYIEADSDGKVSGGVSVEHEF